HKDHAVAGPGEASHQVVLRVRMVIPPVLPGETNNRMSFNHVGFGIIRGQMKPLESTPGEKLDRPSGSGWTTDRLQASRRRLLLLLLIFLTALGVRLLNWQSHHDDALAVQTSVALNYKHQ